MEHDYNAEKADDLKSTHGNFFSLIRRHNKNLPIILMSRFSEECSISSDETTEQRKVIGVVYNNTVCKGDKNTYFVDGSTVFTKK